MHRPPNCDNRGAIDAESAQVTCQLVCDQLDAVAVKAALAVLGERERPLALTVGDMHFGALQ